jgi:hypothetical protein
MWVSTNRRIKVQTGLGIKCDPISEIADMKNATVMVQVVGNLSSKCKCEALISNPSTRKKGGGREGVREGRRKEGRKGGRKEGEKEGRKNKYKGERVSE